MNLSIKKSITTILSISLIVKLLGFIYKFFVARFLGFDGMTVFSLLSPILSLSLCLSSLSIPTVVNQKVSENISKKTYSNRLFILSSLKLTFLSSTIICLALLILGKIISNFIYKNPYLEYPIYLLIPIIFFSNMSGVLKGYLDAHNLFKTTQTANLIEQITKIFFCLVCITLLNKENLTTIIIAIVIILGLCEINSFTFLILKIRKITPLTINKEALEYKPIIKKAIPLTLDHLICSIVSFLEPIILYNIVDYGEGLKYYTIISGYASTLLLMSHFICHGINKAFFPKYCAINEKKEIYKTFNKALFLSLFVGIINLNICFFHSKTALNLLYGTDIACTIVKELSIFYFITYTNPLIVCILQAKSYEKELLINTIISHITELILLISLCFIFGIKGFKYTIIISSLFDFLLNYITLRNNLGFKFCINKIIKIIILLSINFTISILIKNEIVSFIISNIITLYILFIYFKIRNLNNVNSYTITRSIKDF